MLIPVLLTSDSTLQPLEIQTWGWSLALMISAWSPTLIKHRANINCSSHFWDTVESLWSLKSDTVWPHFTVWDQKTDKITVPNWNFSLVFRHKPDQPLRSFADCTGKWLQIKSAVCYRLQNAKLIIYKARARWPVTIALVLEACESIGERV